MQRVPDLCQRPGFPNGLRVLLFSDEAAKGDEVARALAGTAVALQAASYVGAGLRVGTEALVPTLAELTRWRRSDAAGQCEQRAGASR